MTHRRADHIVWDAPRARFRCERCGFSYKPTMPCPVSVFVATSKEIIRLHRNCKAPA